MGELDTVLKGEQNNYEAAYSQMGDSVSIIEDLIKLYELMASSVVVELQNFVEGRICQLHRRLIVFA